MIFHMGRRLQSFFLFLAILFVQHSLVLCDDSWDVALSIFSRWKWTDDSWCTRKSSQTNYISSSGSSRTCHSILTVGGTSFAKTYDLQARTLSLTFTLSSNASVEVIDQDHHSTARFVAPSSLRYGDVRAVLCTMNVTSTMTFNLSTSDYRIWSRSRPTSATASIKARNATCYATDAVELLPSITSSLTAAVTVSPSHSSKLPRSVSASTSSDFTVTKSQESMTMPFSSSMSASASSEVTATKSHESKTLPFRSSLSASSRNGTVTQARESKTLPFSSSISTSSRCSNGTATKSFTSHITKSNSLSSLTLFDRSLTVRTPTSSIAIVPSGTNAGKSTTKSTSPEIQSLTAPLSRSTSIIISNTPSAALLPASPPPTEPPPVAVASQAIVTTVIVSSTLVAASAAGGAVMQAALSAAACAKDDDAADEAPGMSMYIVSPFVGNDYGMVYGNMALVLACCLLHVGAAMIVRQIRYFAASNTRAAMAAVRFPHATLLFGGLAVQGVLLGGWQALWVVVRNEADGGGEVVALLLTFVASVFYGVGLIYFLVRMRRALCLPLVSSSRPFEANLLQSGSVLQAHLVADYNVENVASCAPCSLVWGPQNIWTPNDYRRMYGVSFNDYHGISVHQERWLIASVAGLPWLVAAASATRPDRASRLMVCNGVMLLVGLLLLLHAACIVWFAPLRVRVRNPIAALVVVWMSVTCMLSSPLLRDAVGGDATGTILSVIGVLQGATILSQILVELWSYYAVERYVLRAVTERDDAQLHLLDEEEEEMLPVVDATAGLMKLDESDAGMDDEQEDLNDVEFGVDDCEEEVDLLGGFGGLHGTKEAADSELQNLYGNWSLR